MPEDRTFTESSLCSLGPRPHIMTGIFVTLLRNHFSDANNIESEVFRTRLFKTGTDADETGVMIEDATVWTPSRTGKRPAVVVRRNAWDHQKRTTFDSRAGTTAEGHGIYVKFWRGSHTIFCIANTGTETEILGAETYRMLMHFGPVFREYFKLMQLEIMQYGQLARVEEATQRFVVPITLAYGWSEQWIIREHVPPLQDVRLSQIFSTYYGDEGNN